jgi:hypothetical protein
MFENRVLRRIFEPKSDERREGGKNCITMSFMICTLRQVKGNRREPDVFEMDSTKQLGVVGSGTRYYSPR